MLTYLLPSLSTCSRDLSSYRPTYQLRSPCAKPLSQNTAKTSRLVSSTTISFDTDSHIPFVLFGWRGTPWCLPHAPTTHKRGMGPPVVQATLRHGNLGRIMLSHVDSRYKHSRISEDKPPCTLYLWPGSTPQSCISWLSLHSASGQGVLPSQVACVYHLWPMSTPQPLLLLMFHVIKRLTRPNALR